MLVQFTFVSVFFLAFTNSQLLLINIPSFLSYISGLLLSLRQLSDLYVDLILFNKVLFYLNPKELTFPMIA